MYNETRWALIGLISVMALHTPSSDAPAQERRRPIAFVNVTLLPMTSGDTIPGQTVVVREGLLAEVGDASLVEVEDDVLVIDGSGRYLMPGLIDSHVHVFDENDFPLLLAFGITSVLNMSGAPLHLEWRRAIEAGEISGPALYTTGPQLKLNAEPVVDFERAVTSADDAERLVAYQAQAGYDFVKVWGAFDPEVYEAIVKAARRHGVRVMGHIPRDVGLEAVLNAGQSSVAHVEEYYNKYFMRQMDETRLQAAVEISASHNVPVITTLITYEAIAASVADDPTPLLERPGRELLDPIRQMLWEPDFNRYRTPRRLGRDDEYRAAQRFQMKIAAALSDAGVPLLAGSDAGELPGLVPGYDLHRELELLVEAGLTPAAALATATRNPGAFLGGDRPFGTVTEGSRADLLLLEANPLDDIRNTRRIAGVMNRGAYRSRSDLDTLLAELVEINERTGRFVKLVMSSGVAAASQELAGSSGQDPAFPLTPALFLAFALAQQGDEESALGVLQLVAREYPDSYLPHYMMGAALLAAGATADGKAALQKVLELSPGHDGALRLLAQ